MSKICNVCGKGPITGNSVSHSNHHSKRRWLPNLQSIKVSINGSNRRIRICTSCLKAGKVKRAV